MVETMVLYLSIRGTCNNKRHLVDKKEEVTNELIVIRVEMLKSILMGII